MSPIQAILYGALLPAGVTALLLAFSIQMPDILRRVTHLVAPGFGFLFSFYLLFGEPQNPITQIGHWIVFLPFIFVAVFIVQEIKKQSFSKNQEIIFSLLPSVLISYLFLRIYQIEVPWVGVIGLNFASFAYFFFFFKRYHKDLWGLDSLVVSLVALTLLSGLLMMTGSLSQAQLVGVFASLNGVFVLWNFIFRNQNFKHIHVSVSLAWLLLPWIFMALSGILYSETPSSYMLVLGGATAVSSALLKYLKIENRWKRLMISLCPLVIAGVAVIGLAIKNFGIPA